MKGVLEYIRVEMREEIMRMKKGDDGLEEMMKRLEIKEEEMDGLVMLVNKKESYLKQQLDEDVKQIEEDKSCLNKLNVDKQEEMVGDD